MIQYNQETQIFMNKDLKNNFLARKRDIINLEMEKQELQIKYQNMMNTINKLSLIHI